jgi:hypothetical protein
MFYHSRGQNPGVETHFRLVKTCIDATFMDRFAPNLAGTVDVLCRSIFCITPWVNTRGQNPFPVGQNMYKSHIYGTI